MDGMDSEEPSTSRGHVKRGHTTGMQFGDHTSNTFHKSVKVVFTNTPQPPQTKSRIEFKVQDPIESFTGREDILEELHKTIQESKSKEKVTVLSQAKVITGIGGLGKTETVRKYAFDYKHSYGHTLWINAETYSRAKDCFMEIASLCNVSSENFDSRRAQIVDKIYDYLCQEHSLLVFDNAESLGTANSEEGIRPFLPMAFKTGWVPPAIVATSRNREWGPAALIELPGLNDNECFDLLTVQLKLSDTQENRECARRITEMCEGLPLVVQQVITIINDTSRDREILGLPAFTMKDFLSDVHDRGQDITNAKPADSPVGSTSYEIFNMAFDRILKKENGEIAFRCLSVMAVLNPDNIPAKLIMSLIAPMTTDVTILGKALNMLRDQNLITLTPHDGGYRMHRVIQLVAILYNNKKSETDVINNAKTNLKLFRKEITSGPCLTTLDTLGSIIPPFVDLLKEIPLHDDNLNGVLRIGLQLASQIQNKSGVEGIAIFLKALAEKLYAAGKYSQAEKMWEDLLEIYEREKRTSTEKCYAKFQLAWACHQQGKYDAALRILKKVLETRELELGPDHEDTLRTKGMIGNVYQGQGKYEDAIKLQEYVLNKKTILFGSNDARTVRTKHNLALLLKDTGKCESALELFNDVIKYQEQQLRPNNPSFLLTKNNVADLLQKLGRLDEAIGMLEDTLQRKQSVLGRNHPNTLQTQRALAHALVDKGEYERVFELFEEVLNLQESHLGPQHANTLYTRNQIALVLGRLGEDNTQVQMLEKFSRIQQRILEPNHPDAFVTKGNPTYASYDSNKRGTSECKGLNSNLKQSGEAIIETTGPCLTTSDILASIIPHFSELLKKIPLNDCRLNDVLQNGLRLASQLQKNSRVEGKVIFLKALAEKLIEAGKNCEAEKIWEDLLEVHEIENGTFKETCYAKRQLGWSCHLQGKHEAALKIFTDLLETQKLVLESDHAEILRTKMYLALAYRTLGKYDNSIKLLEYVLKKREMQLGSNNDSTAATKHNLALVLSDLGENERSYELYCDVIEYRERSAGPNNPSTLLSKCCLADVLYKLGWCDDAIDIYEDTLQRRQSVLGRNHPCTLSTKLDLAGALAETGSCERAFQLYDEVLNSQETHLGPNHADTLKTRNQFALVLGRLGKHDALTNMLEKSLTNQQRVVGRDHPDVLVTKYKLADAFYNNHEYVRAAELYEEKLMFQSGFYGSNSPKTLRTKSRLAYSFKRIRKYGAALEIYQQILEDQEKTLGTNHPDTLGTKHTMAWNLRKLGRYDEALRACEDILNSVKQAPDVIYNEILGIKDEIARIYVYQGKYEEAVHIFEDVLEHDIKTLGSNHAEAKKTEQRLREARDKKANAAEEMDRNVTS